MEEITQKFKRVTEDADLKRKEEIAAKKQALKAAQELVDAGKKMVNGNNVTGNYVIENKVTENNVIKTMLLETKLLKSELCSTRKYSQTLK